MPPAVLWLVASYFVGAIPTSYLLSRLFAGIDLRQHGSGNLGATSDILIELTRGGTQLSVRWPSTQAASCAAWLHELAAVALKE